MLKKTVSVLPVSECPAGTVTGPGIFGEHCAQREAGKEVGQESPRAGIAGLGEVHGTEGHCLLASAEPQFLRVSPIENIGERRGCQDAVLARAEAGALIWSARPLSH